VKLFSSPDEPLHNHLAIDQAHAARTESIHRGTGVDDSDAVAFPDSREMGMPD